MLSLVGVYRGQWRWPLQAVEVWRADTELLAIIPHDLLVELVAHYLNGIVLERRFAEVVTDSERAASRPRLVGTNGRRLRAWTAR